MRAPAPPKYFVERLNGRFSAINKELKEVDFEIEDKVAPEESIIEYELFTEMEKWKWRIDTVLGMFSNVVVGMALTQFIILFVSTYMESWIELNSRICMLWS